MRALFVYFLFLPIFLFAQNDLEPTLVATGFISPVAIASAGDDRLFVVEQSGRIQIMNTKGERLTEPFLDIRNEVHDLDGNEQGLLGLTFHPDYANNGYFFVNYTIRSASGTNRVSRFQVDPMNPNRALLNSEKIIMELEQPATNHNGGGLEFGPDGYLYIGFGDGGSFGDPWGNSQNPLVLLGKMLRVDINTDQAYLIPEDNPFADTDFVLDEIWATGLRNPWRYSFDRLTGDLWIADVGQNQREEIDFQPASSEGGENYGWDCREGDINYSQPDASCEEEPVVIEPIHSYKVSNTCNSVTGGYVYRGCRYPDLYGRYLYAEFCQGHIWSLTPDGSEWKNEQLFRQLNFDISTFGQDHEGELYVARWRTGDIYRLGMGDTLAAPAISQAMQELSVPDNFVSYQWYLNGQQIDGATAATFTAIEEGTYTCEVTHTNNCTTRSELVLIGTGLDQLPEVDLMNLFPNPSNGQFELQLQLNSPQAFKLQLFNIQGQRISEHRFSASGAWKQAFDWRTLPDGLYWLRLETEEGSVSRKFIIGQ